jgi:hypothetical protein
MYELMELKVSVPYTDINIYSGIQSSFHIRKMSDSGTPSIDSELIEEFSQDQNLSRISKSFFVLVLLGVYFF